MVLYASWCTDETCPYLPCHGHGMVKVANYQLQLIMLKDHIYFYYFEGDGTSEIFSFEDGGGYGDNGGSLNIEIYEMVNPYQNPIIH